MNTKLQYNLLLCETDIDGSLHRFVGNEDIYISYVKKFPSEPTMAMFMEAMEKKDWETAFATAHALKGLSGNLGFVPLYHAVGEMVLLLRASKYDEAEQAYDKIKQCYEELVNAINQGIN